MASRGQEDLCSLSAASSEAVHTSNQLDNRSAAEAQSILDCLQDVASMAFSADGHLLAVQGGAPDYTLIVWVWEKAKSVDSLRIAPVGTAPPVCQARLHHTLLLRLHMPPSPGCTHGAARQAMLQQL